MAARCVHAHAWGGESAVIMFVVAVIMALWQ
jgi:hypothetical protein